jgi:hypothetical protein
MPARCPALAIDGVFRRDSYARRAWSRTVTGASCRACAQSLHPEFCYVGRAIGTIGISHRTSFAGLSSRSPTNTVWRRSPSSDQARDPALFPSETHRPEPTGERVPFRAVRKYCGFLADRAKTRRQARWCRDFGTCNRADQKKSRKNRLLRIRNIAPSFRTVSLLAYAQPPNRQVAGNAKFKRSIPTFPGMRCSIRVAICRRLYRLAKRQSCG